jgi:hypothetical protein
MVLAMLLVTIKSIFFNRKLQSSAERDKTMASGCDDYINKPINRILLNELIGKHCNK